jgi:hypothetical protein
MRKLYTVIFALTVLLSTSVSVNAMEYKEVSRQDGAYAFADWTETNGNVTTYTYLSVDETNDGTYVHVSMYTYDSETGYYSDKWGSMNTQDDVFSIDKKLDSASLSQVEIVLYEQYYDETEGYYMSKEAGTLNVKADWTGIGDLSKGSFKYTSKDGDYAFRSTDSSLSRDASVTGSINGIDLGSQYYASMVSFKSAYMSMEK